MWFLARLPMASPGVPAWMPARRRVDVGWMSDRPASSFFGGTRDPRMILMA
jgi:hypothetical protein